MYKLSYYRYAEASLMTTGQLGFDRVRNVQIGKMDVSLEYFEEVCRWAEDLRRAVHGLCHDMRLPKLKCTYCDKSIQLQGLKNAFVRLVKQPCCACRCSHLSTGWSASTKSLTSERHCSYV